MPLKQNSLSSIYKSKTIYMNFALQIEVSAHQRSVHSEDRTIIWRLKKYSVCRSKNICRSKSYLWIEELSADQGSMWRWKFNLQIKEVFLFRSKNYLQVKELPADWRIICRLESYLQIQKLSAEQSIRSVDWGNICKSKNYVLIEEVFYLQTEELSADWRITSRSNFNL